MSAIFTNFYSDLDMQCPGSWYGGFKEARVMRFGDGERTLSHLRTGEWAGSTFTLQISDYDRSIRERLADASHKFWSEPLTVRMVDRPTRAALGVPYTVFVGPIIEARATGQGALAWDLTLGDIVSRALLSDQAIGPWRIVGDGLLDQLSAIAEGLDLETPEPTIYGIHKRLPTDPASGEGLAYAPTYLGVMPVSGNDYHVWLVAGHACADIPDLHVDYISRIANEGSDWFVPHSAGWTSLMGADPFVDYRSRTYGNDRRYTLVLGKKGNADPDACAEGSKLLTLWVEGVEANGDGSGTVETDRLKQYKHWVVNYVANQGQASYQAGSWLSSPFWNVFGGNVAMVDEDSFDACSDIAFERFPPGGSPGEPGGYRGAAVIGARAGDRKRLSDWIADWNRSCAVRNGITNIGQFRVVMLHPTDAIKAAAPLFDDVNAILQDSFDPEVLWSEHANRIPFRTDFNHATGKWETQGASQDEERIEEYGRIIEGETRDYPFAVGFTQSYHLATLEVRVTKDPPRTVAFETALGPLATLDLGDYVRYRHFGSIGTSASQIRLGWVQRHQVQAGKRRVLVEVLDVEDLIGFDVDPVAEDAAPTNYTCAAAVEVSLNEDGNVRYTLDTTLSPTDESVGPPLLPDPGVAYHPAWYKFTAPSAGNLSIITTTSAYDTVLAILSGTCGGSPQDWTLLNSNDNESVGVTTSGATVDLTEGQEVYVLVYGFGPDDGGYLLVQFSFAPEEP